MKIGDISFKYDLDSSNFLKESAKVDSALKKTEDNSKRASKSLNNQAQSISTTTMATASALGQIGAGIVTTGATKAFELVKTGLFDVGNATEQTRIALTTMTGSSKIAGNMLSELNETAKKTPYEFNELSSSMKQLVAFDEPIKKVNNTIKVLGDIASGTNSELGQISYIYGQIRAVNVAYTGDLNQLASRGIPIYGELAKMLKKTPEGIKDLASTGKITFPMIETAMSNMTKKGGMFYNSMQAQSESLQGITSTLSDEFTNFGLKILGIGTSGTEAGKILEGGFASKVKDSITDLTNFVSYMNENFSWTIITENERVKKFAEEWVKLSTNVYNFVTTNKEGLVFIQNMGNLILDTTNNLIRFSNWASESKENAYLFFSLLALAAYFFAPALISFALVTGAVTLFTHMINEGINILDDFGWNLGRMGEIMVINFVRPFKKGVNDIIDGLNQLISGYNSTVGVFGSGLTMPLISRLYSGTQNFQGGFANINDLGKNEGLSLPSAGGGFVTYLPQNTKVYSGSTTERMTSNNDSNIQYVISLKDITTPMILEFFRLNLLQFKKLGFEIKN